MYLLNVRSRRLEYFEGNKIPRYAILSHRWEQEEITFHDVDRHPEVKKGYQKLDMCCLQALECGTSQPHHLQADSIEYVWIDTCCIDKKSSAELSEAINSMYQWYAQAAVCYVYLSDVHDRRRIEESIWFTRGWTLQELLAPQSVLFFDSEWQFIGTRNCIEGHDSGCVKCLSQRLQRRTQIPMPALSGFKPDPFSDGVIYSIAEKMTWSAGRETTRDEDMAYSLLGLFGVSMPLLYGEGMRAFQRLQEAIMQVDNDLSIFAWNGSSCQSFGMLASSPVCFRGSAPLINHGLRPSQRLTSGFSTNNGGLSIVLAIEPWMPERPHGSRTFVAYLHEPAQIVMVVYMAKVHGYKSLDWATTRINSDDPPGLPSIGIYLEKREGQYRRVALGGDCFVQQPADQIFRRMSANQQSILISRVPLINLERRPILISISHDKSVWALRRERVDFLETPNWKMLTPEGGDSSMLELHPGFCFGFFCQLVRRVDRKRDCHLFLGFDKDLMSIGLAQLVNSKDRRFVGLHEHTNQGLMNMHRHVMSKDVQVESITCVRDEDILTEAYSSLNLKQSFHFEHKFGRQGADNPERYVDAFGLRVTFI